MWLPFPWQRPDGRRLAIVKGNADDSNSHHLCGGNAGGRRSRRRPDLQHNQHSFGNRKPRQVLGCSDEAGSQPDDDADGQHEHDDHVAQHDDRQRQFINVLADRSARRGDEFA